MVYIGEGETLKTRIKEHASSEDKDFWRECLGIIRTGEGLNKAQIRYLEGRMIELANSMGRFSVLNVKTTSTAGISESDQAEMDEFLSKIRLLVYTLGYRIFEPLGGSVLTGDQALEELLYIENTKGIKATGRLVSEGFQVIEGSIASATTTPSYQDWAHKVRNELIESGRLVQNGDMMVFKENVIFTSPSTAAAVVLGRSANGLTEWKTKDGKNLKNLESGE